MFRRAVGALDQATLTGPAGHRPGRGTNEQTVESFTIITTAANAAMAPLHDRMQVMIQPSHHRWWLEHKPGSELYLSALHSPLAEPLKIYPVSNLVNQADRRGPL